MGRISAAVRRFRLSLGLLAAAIVLGAVGGALLGAQQRAVYRATASVFVSTSSASSVDDLASAGVARLRGGVSRYGDMATTPLVLNRVIDQLGLRSSAAALARRMHVDNPAGTVVLHIGVDDAQSADAVRIADAVVRAETDTVAERVKAGSNDAIQLTLLESAGRTVGQVQPDIPLDAAVGALAGLLAAVAVVLLLHRDEVRLRWRR
jgi:capsular polysaccharide biosynthesis protein